MQNNFSDIPIEHIIPHRKPMLLLDKLTYANDNNFEATFTIDEHCVFLKENSELETMALVEILAQCFAAGNGMINPQPFGYLASMRNIKIHGKACLGDTLLAKVKLITKLGDIMVIEGMLFNKEICIVEGQFKIFTPSNQEHNN